MVRSPRLTWNRLHGLPRQENEQHPEVLKVYILCTCRCFGTSSWGLPVYGEIGIVLRGRVLRSKLF